MGDTPKLFEVSKIIKKFIQKELPKLHKLLKKKKVIIEPLIASCFITLFSNLVDIENATKVMERFMLLGEDYIVDTVCEVLWHN
jgi:Rab-GTPase-TBC domain